MSSWQRAVQGSLRIVICPIYPSVLLILKSKDSNLDINNISL